MSSAVRLLGSRALRLPALRRVLSSPAPCLHAAPFATSPSSSRPLKSPHNRTCLSRPSCSHIPQAAAVAAEEQTSLQLEIRFDAPVERTPPTFLTTTVGDVHGDLSKAVGCLELAGVIEMRGMTPTWIGGDAIVVQLGDILDRGDAEVATLMLFRQLHRAAVKDGGAVYVLNGNHESLNVCGDFRYVTEGAFQESGMVMGLQGENLSNLDMLVRARLALYAPGQPMAIELSKNPTVLVINDSVFAHGGLLPMHTKYGVERINAEVAAWMRADETESGGFAPPPFIAMGDSNAVMWNRTFGKEKWTSSVQRIHTIQLAEAALHDINCNRMVVGHTPQMEGANSECDGMVWRLDVGLSRGMLDAPPCVLEIAIDPVTGASMPKLLRF